MTAVLDLPPPTTLAIAEPRSPADRGLRGWLRTPRWNRFTLLQLVVLVMATVAPLVIASAISANLLGLISTQTLLTIALAAGENPGMITFGAMFLASPIQWRTGNSQVRVRKYLGIVFFLLAVSNFVMFAIESGATAALSTPLLIAGSVAVALSAPLFLTSSRKIQRAMGMKRWRLLHKATYLVAAALVIHVILVGEVGPGFLFIIIGFGARIPGVRRRLQARGQRRRA